MPTVVSKNYTVVRDDSGKAVAVIIRTATDEALSTFTSTAKQDIAAGLAYEKANGE